jgi:predicted DNA-binding transcriptional regulator YafY
MAKRPESIETTILALELLRRIPRNRSISSVELHRQLKDAGIERELRTIQRQLEVLSEHFDIYRDQRSKPYGYRWKEKAAGLALPTLSPQESLLLGLAEEYLKNLLPSKLMKSMDGFFEQARRNLGPCSTAKQEKEWASKVRVVATSQPLLPPQLKPGVFEAVSEALYANNWLEIDYLNSNGRRSKVEVMPLGLAQQGSRLYLVGRYKGYDNERSLALHRMQSAEVVQGEKFSRPHEFDLKKYDDDGRFGYGNGKRIRLKFSIDKAAGLHLLESPLSTDQIYTERDDLYDIEATVVESSMLEWWLRGFGDAIRDIEKFAIN